MTQVASIADIISTQNLLPGVYNKFDPGRAVRGNREMPRSLLLFGPINNVMFNPANFDRPLTLNSDAEARGQLGEDSIGYQMWRAAKANAIKGLPIRFVAQRNDSTAVTREVTITVAINGQRRRDGEQAIYIGGERYSVGVLSTDSVAAIAQKFASKFAVKGNLFRVRSVTGGEIVLTAKTPGQLMNLVDFRARYYRTDQLVGGISIYMKTTRLGVVNPSISAAVANMTRSRDTEWILPYTDGQNMAVLEAELLRRWSHEVQTDVQAIVAMRGSEGVHTTWLQSRNSPLVHSMHTRADMSSPWELAAMAGAAIESAASLDPTTPHTGIPLIGYKPALVDDHLNSDQVNNIMLEGGCSVAVAEDGTATLLRSVTNYTTHNSGAYDTSMRDVCWIKTLSSFRWERNTEFLISFQGFKLGEYAKPIPGQKILTHEVVEDKCLSFYDRKIAQGRMQNADHYKDTLVIELDGTRGIVKIKDEPVLMTQYYQTAITSEWAAGHV